MNIQQKTGLILLSGAAMYVGLAFGYKIVFGWSIGSLSIILGDALFN